VERFLHFSQDGVELMKLKWVWHDDCGDPNPNEDNYIGVEPEAAAL